MDKNILNFDHLSIPKQTGYAFVLSTAFTAVMWTTMILVDKGVEKIDDIKFNREKKAQKNK